MKINTKITLAFLIISLLALSVTSISSYFNAENGITQQVLNQLDSVASIQQNRVNSIIDQNLERLALVATRTQLRLCLNDYIKENNSADQEKMNMILRDARSSIVSFEDISVLNLNGEVVASTNETLIGINYSNEEFFIRGQVDNNVDIFFFDENQNLKVYLSGPLYLETQLLGVVVIKSNVDTLITLVEDYSGLGETGETLLAERDGDGNALFLTPLRFDSQAALKRTVSKDDLDSPITQALLKNERLAADVVDYHGQHVLAATRYIEKTDWGLVVKIDKSEAYGAITQLRYTLVFIILVSSIVIIIVSIYTAKSITRPLNKLTRVASSIGKGDLSQRIELKSKDEIGTLANAFNQMTGNLVDANIDMKKELNERKRAEDALRRSEARLAEAQRIAHLGNWDLDIEKNVLSWSDEIYGIFGLKPQEFGATYEAFLNSVHPDDREFVEKSVNEALSEGKPYSIDHRIVLPDGTERTVHEEGKVFRDETGKPTRLVGVVQDITERKRAEEELKVRVKELEEFHEVVVGRELKMKQMEAELVRLRAKLGEK